MEQVFKICAAVLIVCVVSLVIEKKEKDFTIVLTICTCCCVILFAVSFLNPVLDFIHSLQDIAMVDIEALRIVFKVIGIGMVAEISSFICQDAGKAALAKIVQVSATVLILWISLPLFTNLMELVNKILGGI